MIDQAGILMAQGLGIASERIQGVNDNMSQSHYHEYYEIYYLEAGERFHMVEDQLYKMEAGEFMIFPPYVMHWFLHPAEGIWKLETSGRLNSSARFHVWLPVQGMI